MKIALKSAMLGSALGLAMIAAPQAALAAKKPAAAASNVVAGIGVANPEGIVVASAAFQQAENLRPQTYKATIDAAQARKTQIEAQLKPLYDKLDADAKNPKADRNALQQQAIQIRQIEQAGQQELQQMLAPLDQSRQYVLEQLEDKLGTAMQQAMAKRGVTIVVRRDTVIRYDPAYDINQDVLNELNALIPSAQLVPPQGWLPRAEREAAAAQAAQQGQPAAAPAQPAGPAPDGR
jgi:Skp family chaperone for outer membrane proteins